MLCFRKFLVANFLWIRGGGGGGIRICRRFFFVSETRENSQGNPSVLCSRKLLVAKKFMHKRGVVSGSSVDNFLSYSAEKIRRGTHWCFKIFGYRQCLCFRGLSHDFLSKIFCLTVPKFSVGDPFGFFINFG